MKAYAIAILETTAAITTYGLNSKIPLSWADGMVGVLPVFETMEQAKTYIGDRHATVLEIERKEDEQPN